MVIEGSMDSKIAKWCSPWLLPRYFDRVSEDWQIPLKAESVPFSCSCGFWRLLRFLVWDTRLQPAYKLTKGQNIQDRSVSRSSPLARRTQQSLLMDPPGSLAKTLLPNSSGVSGYRAQEGHDPNLVTCMAHRIHCESDAYVLQGGSATLWALSP